MLDTWLRSKNNMFPREYTSKKYKMARFVINSEKDFNRLMERDNETYLNIFSQYQKTNRLYDTIFIDIDCHEHDDCYANIDEAFEKFLSIYHILIDFDINTRCYFTGMGFHIYIDFPQTNLEFYNEVVINFINNELNLKNIDKNVLGDRNRMARVIGSLHSKSNMFMIRISPEWDLLTIIENSINNINYDGEVKINEWLSMYLENDDKRVSSKKTKYKNVQERNNDVAKFMDDNLNEIKNLPECVKNGLYHLEETGELEHEYRTFIFSYLLMLWGYDKTLNMLVEMKPTDLNIRMTEYHLGKLYNKKLGCASCRKAKEKGICRMDDMKRCPYYELTSGWLCRAFFKEVE